MAVLFGYHDAYRGHDPGIDHPESPRRLEAVRRGIERADVADALVSFAPRPATREELLRVHDASYLEALEARCLAGGALDPDTVVVAGSYEAALRAAGSGPEAIERLDRGEAEAAFLAVRPPGHHAQVERAMGFCILNNVAVATAALVARGERVCVIDWDAHHGNGTQHAFYERDDVLFVSMHQYPAYPGTGAVGEIGAGPGRGTTLNLPFPSGTAGDAYRLALEELIVPAIEEFSATWLVVSAGFDAHREDPLTDLGLSSGDFADLTRIVVHLGPPGRRLFFLEGGYDLMALELSAGACVAGLCGVEYRPERATTGGIENELGAGRGRPLAVIEAARALRERT